MIDRYTGPGPASKKRLLSSFSVSPLPVKDSPVVMDKSHDVTLDSKTTPKKTREEKTQSITLPIKALTPRRVALETVDDSKSSSIEFQSATEKEQPAEVINEIRPIMHDVNVSDDMNVTAAGACGSEIMPMIVSTHSLSQEITPNVDENQTQDMEIEQSYLKSESGMKENCIVICLICCIRQN